MKKILLLLFIIFLAIAILYDWLFIGSIKFSNNEGFCIQVLTSAKNPISGVEKIFGNPCNIPIGWEIIK
jgi:hypothetical protein